MLNSEEQKRGGRVCIDDGANGSISLVRVTNDEFLDYVNTGIGKKVNLTGIPFSLLPKLVSSCSSVKQVFVNNSVWK